VKSETGEKQARIGNNRNAVHQNIRSLWGKCCGQLEILLETEINIVEVLCFTEHWLKCHTVHTININRFILHTTLLSVIHTSLLYNTTISLGYMFSPGEHPISTTRKGSTTEHHQEGQPPCLST
jgi:hypothetical protein